MSTTNMNRNELDTLIDEVERLKDIYESGFLESASAGNDRRLHALLEDFDRGLLWDNFEALQNMRKLLAYRVDPLARAGRHAKNLGLSPVNGDSFGVWPGFAYGKFDKKDWKHFDGLMMWSEFSSTYYFLCR